MREGEVRCVDSPEHSSTEREFASQSDVAWRLTHDNVELDTTHDVGFVQRTHWVAYVRRAHGVWHAHVREMHVGACSHDAIAHVVRIMARLGNAPLQSLYLTKNIARD